MSDKIINPFKHAFIKTFATTSATYEHPIYRNDKIELAELINLLDAQPELAKLYPDLPTSISGLLKEGYLDLIGFGAGRAALYAAKKADSYPKSALYGAAGIGLHVTGLLSSIYRFIIFVPKLLECVLLALGTSLMQWNPKIFGGGVIKYILRSFVDTSYVLLRLFTSPRNAANAAYDTFANLFGDGEIPALGYMAYGVSMLLSMVVWGLYTAFVGTALMSALGVTAVVGVVASHMPVVGAIFQHVNQWLQPVTNFFGKALSSVGQGLKTFFASKPSSGRSGGPFLSPNPTSAMASQSMTSEQAVSFGSQTLATSMLMNAASNTGVELTNLNATAAPAVDVPVADARPIETPAGPQQRPFAYNDWQAFRPAEQNPLLRDRSRTHSRTQVEPLGGDDDSRYNRHRNY